jgi:hypothetical protein
MHPVGKNQLLSLFFWAESEVKLLLQKSGCSSPHHRQEKQLPAVKLYYQVCRNVRVYVLLSHIQSFTLCSRSCLFTKSLKITFRIISIIKQDEADQLTALPPNSQRYIDARVHAQTGMAAR